MEQKMESDVNGDWDYLLLYRVDTPGFQGCTPKVVPLKVSPILPSYSPYVVP